MVQNAGRRADFKLLIVDCGKFPLLFHNLLCFGGLFLCLVAYFLAKFWLLSHFKRWLNFPDLSGDIGGVAEESAEGAATVA